MRRTLFGACAALVIVACTTATDAPPVASISLSPTADSVETGRASNGFVVTLLDGAGKTLTGRRVDWRSANDAIATVDASGKVTGVSLGQTVITATADGRSANANVKVIIPVAQIVLSPDSLDVPLTTSRQISAQLVGPNGEGIIGRVPTWASANPSVATVSGTGLVNSVSVGTVSITVSAGAQVATARVRVVPEPVSLVRITPQIPVQVVRLGQTFQLSATCYNNSGQVLTRPITWTSSNPSVATVGAGLVAGLALGTAIVTADCDGRTAQITIQVSPVLVASVVITPPALTINVGSQQQLAVTARDSANNILNLVNPPRSVIWTSDNLPVAGVSNQGVVVGFAPGVANIQVTVDGVVSSPIAVTVENVPVATVQVTAPVSPANVKLNTTMQLTPILRDSNGNVLSTVGRTIQWSSSDPSFASVSVNGLVTGHQVTGGPVTIQATCEGKVGSIQINVVP
jgi:uncharacterized protein YjdB